jgi:hypothetical protein
MQHGNRNVTRQELSCRTPPPHDISGGRYFGRDHDSAARPYGHNTTKVKKTSTERWWSYTDRGYRCAGGGTAPV